MLELLFRFLVGGLIVSTFAVIGDMLKPKSFAGIFGAAPSVALATLTLSFATQGSSSVALQAQSMLAGAVAMFCYSLLVAWLILRYRYKALIAASVSWLLWLAVAFGLWLLWQQVSPLSFG